MKKCTFYLFVGLLLLGFSDISAQQWNGPDNTTSRISREGRLGLGVTNPLQSLHIGGNLRLEGSTIFFGPVSRLAKIGSAAMGFRSNHPTISQFILRDSLNRIPGRLIGYKTAAAANIFALRNDLNKNFIINYHSGNIEYTALLVNGRNTLTARLYDEGLATESRRVGINTSGPRRELDVRGSAIVNHLYVSTNSSGGFDTDEYKMFVDGKAAFEEVRVQLSQNWGDYVFSPSYELRSLIDLRKYIKENGHLPNFHSAEEMEEGLEVSDIVHRQMITIEELTLYTLEQQKEIDELKAQVQQLVETVKAVAADK